MDDVISLIRIGLQSCLDDFKVYYQKWKVTVKNKKTEVMIVEKRQAPVKCNVVVSKGAS